jgi:hypothetical protein
VTLTLIAEVLSGETTITPGGPVDTDTACGLEAFTWDGWLEQTLAERAGGEPVAEVSGAAVVPAEALVD